MFALLRLAAAHFVGDFVLQPRWLATRKRSARWLAAHAAIHCVLYLAVLIPWPRSEAVKAAIGLALIHAAIDFLKGLRPEDGIVIFLC